MSHLRFTNCLLHGHAFNLYWSGLMLRRTLITRPSARDLCGACVGIFSWCCNAKYGKDTLVVAMHCERLCRSFS